jgi:hypothetical protein
MDIILAFIWGMITVVYGLMAVVVVQMKKSVKELESQIRDTKGGIEDIYLQIEKTNSELAFMDLKNESKLTDYSDGLHTHLYDEMNKVYAYIDSRFDKFENRQSNGTDDKIKQLKTQFDEFVRTYQNQ